MPSYTMQAIYHLTSQDVFDDNRQSQTGVSPRVSSSAIEVCFVSFRSAAGCPVVIAE